MKVSAYFNDIGGEWIEFQVSPIQGLDKLEFWKKDSIFLYGFQDIPYHVFGTYLIKHWPVGFDQIAYDKGMSLANDIREFPELVELSDWIKKHLTKELYLNVLGI